ncbi:MAG: TonB-dependent receptor [Paludibacter sp.]
MKYTNFKLKLRSVVAVFLMFFISATVFAQKTSISGVVKDAGNGDPILGANIFEKGTSNGTITNFDGQFTLSVSANATLVIKYVGYVPVEVAVGNQKNLVVQMKEDAVSLGEVVAIGYGVQKKSDKTGAVMNVSSADFNKGVLTDPIQALQGKASGVQITKKGGNPNDGFSVQIRGAGGLATGSSPLYVIDGVPGVDPTTIPAEDIESFNILKDASSTAIYGSRGANGVVIITTKKGTTKGGKNTIDVNAYVTMDEVAKRLDLLSASDIRSFIQRNKLTQVDAGGDTDWQNEIYRKGLTQNYNVAVGGGTDKSNYRVSGTISDFQGVVKGTDKQRFTTTANVFQKLLNDKLVIDGNMAATFEENNYQDFGGNGPTDVMYQAFQRSPLQPVNNPDGTYYENPPYGFQYFNPVATINNIQNQRSAKRIRANGSAQYEIFPGLKAKINGAYTRDDSESFYFVPSSSPTSGTKGKGERKYENHTTKLLEGFVNYDKTFDKVHSLSVVGGYSWQGQINDGFNAFGTNAQSAYVQSNNLGALADVSYGGIGSYKNDWKIISFFGRAAYDFDKKYFATVTVRRDGSSKFGSNNKWGTFPSGSLAWAAKNESFLKDVDWLDQLKLRVGYGLTGNTEGFESYWSVPVINPTGMQPSMDDGVSHTVVYQTSRDANPDLKWETMQEVNIGLDWGILNSRLQGSIELYSRRTVDLIYKYSLPQPPSKTGEIMANAGIMTNKGIEANVSYQVVDLKNFNFKTSLTFSHNINNVEKLSDGIYQWKDKQRSYISARGMVGQWTQYLNEGMSMGTWYLPHFVDISSDGVFRYATATGGITRNVGDAERRNAGSAMPKVNLGWSNSFSIYKNIDMSFSVRAVLGYKVYNVSAMYFSNPTLLPSYNANQQAITWFENKVNATPVASDYWLEDGSFVRLDNLTLGYNVPNTNKFGVSKLRVYFTGSNLLTITGYKGIDPELSYSGVEFGLDNFNVYPKTRSFTLGLQLTF